MYAEHAVPRSTRSFDTVFRATPVMRQVERRELPSVRAATTAARFAGERTFAMLCLSGQALSRGIPLAVVVSSAVRRPACSRVVRDLAAR